MTPRFFVLPLAVLFTCNASIAAPKAARPAFEPKAHALLKKVFDHYRSLRSYSGTMRWTRGGTSLDSLDQRIAGGQTEVRVAQPKAFLSIRIDHSDFGQRYVDDGKDVYVNVFPEDVLRFSNDTIEQDQLWKFAHASEFGIRALLQRRNPLQPYGSYVVAIAPGPERKKGEAHVIVRLQGPEARGQIDYYLGREDLSLHGLRLHQVVKGKTFDESEEHSNLKFNSTIPASELEPDAEMKRLAEATLAKPTPQPTTTPQ